MVKILLSVSQIDRNYRDVDDILKTKTPPLNSKWGFEIKHVVTSIGYPLAILFRKELKRFLPINILIRCQRHYEKA
jgi:hypothetical protein